MHKQRSEYALDCVTADMVAGDHALDDAVFCVIGGEGSGVKSEKAILMTCKGSRDSFCRDRGIHSAAHLTLNRELRTELQNTNGEPRTRKRERLLPTPGCSE